MKGSIAQNVLSHQALQTKPPKHMRTIGDGKPGQKFNGDRFATLCAERGLDPAELLLDVIEDPEQLAELKPKDRADIYLKMMEYAYAKRRAVEVQAEVEHKHSFVAPRELTEDEWITTFGSHSEALKLP